jgi:hypothetical protein
MKINCISNVSIVFESVSFYHRLQLNKVWEHQASSLGRILSNHCHGSAFSNDWPTWFSIFPLILVPSMKYPSKR